MPRFSAALSLAAGLLGLASSAPAQFDREMGVPTDEQTFYNFSTAGISTLVAQGYRLTDIEVTPAGSGLLFSGAAVRNTGAYNTGWWWYYGKTPAQLLSHANQHGARLIDVERYVVGRLIRYAGIMIDNTGPDAVQWYLWSEVEYADVSGLLSSTSSRIVDVEHHQANGQNRLTLLAVRNAGHAARAWWYYIDFSLAHIAGKLTENDARLIDLQRIGPNRWAGIMIQDNVGAQWWYYSVSMAHVLERKVYHKARVIDLETYLDGGTPRTLAIMVDNFENFRPFGAGCATDVGVLEQDVVSGNGFLGRAVHYRGRNFVPHTAGVFNLGVLQASLPLTLLGRPDCTLLVDPMISMAFSLGASGVRHESVQVPNDPALANVEFHTQFAALDRGSVSRQFASSNGVTTCIRD